MKREWQACFMLGVFTLLFGLGAQAGVLAQAELVVKIPLAAKPASRPMTVAYVPDHSRYYIADGGLAPMPDAMGIPVSDSKIDAYSAQGEHLQTIRPNLDNRSLYYNPLTRQLESVTYNASSWAGFTPNSGIYAISLDASGNMSGSADMVAGPNPAFGGASTMPSFDAAERIYYAKQERSGDVLLVQPEKREALGKIRLDLAAAGVRFDDISDSFVAYTGVPGAELALLDVDHKAVLVFDRQGGFVGRCALPAALKLRANNHYSGLGYANGLFFVYHEPEGEYGTYHGFRIFATAQ